MNSEKTTLASILSMFEDGSDPLNIITDKEPGKRKEPTPRKQRTPEEKAAAALERSNRAKVNPNYGMKGKQHTQESREKISTALKGRKFSDEHKKNMSLSKKNNPTSEETRKKAIERQRRTRENRRATDPNFYKRTYLDDLGLDTEETNTNTNTVLSDKIQSILEHSNAI